MEKVLSVVEKHLIAVLAVKRSTTALSIIRKPTGESINPTVLHIRRKMTVVNMGSTWLLEEILQQVILKYDLLKHHNKCIQL